MGIRTVIKSPVANRGLLAIITKLDKLRNNHRSRFSLHELVLMELAARSLQDALTEADQRPEVMQEMTS